MSTVRLDLDHLGRAGEKKRERERTRKLQGETLIFGK